MPRIFLIVFLLAAAVLSAQQPQPTEDTRSLAERAAAAHKNKSANNDGSSTKSFRQSADCGYKNSAFGLEMKCPDGWFPIGGDEASVGVASQALGATSRRIVPYAIQDGSGESIIVLVIPQLLAEKPDKLKAEVVTGVKAKMSEADCNDDNITLTDATHHFIAVRCSLPLGPVKVLQSYQLLQVKGYLFSTIVTTGSIPRIQELINLVRTNMTWTAPEATPTP